MTAEKHKHAIKHWPQTSSGSGYAVCECGATIAIVNGRPIGTWHECKLCVGGKDG